MVALDREAERLIALALEEDAGGGDWTTRWTVDAAARAEAAITAKAPGVVAGIAIAEAVFRRLDPALAFDACRADGAAVAPGDRVCTLCGAAHAILTGERTALNFLQRLSGIATATRRYVDAIAGSGARILDTRKTTPGWRRLEKAAVRAGGGMNHRAGLHDMVLIKENHITAAGGISAAVRRVRAHNRGGLPIEVEVRTLAELDEVLALGVDRVLLDNMGLDEMRDAVARARALGTGRPALEASGNVTLERAATIAAAGVDLISVGALTHSAPALDLSLTVWTL